MILESDVSDHFSTLTNIYGLYAQKDDSEVYYRNTNLSNEQWALFNSELQYNLACNLPIESEEVDINEYASCVTNTYKNLIEKYMPRRKKTKDI